MKNFLSRNLAIIVAIALYLLSVFLITPWGNFPISDDFYYLAQVKAFSLGIFTKSALIGPTLILQSFIGLIWSWFFGLSYVSLRILTIVISIFCLVGLERILSLLNVRMSLKLGTLVLITFMPQFYACSLTFMSENYFLLFVIFSLYFFLKFNKSLSSKDLLLASVLGGLSIMIRQYGVILLGSYLIIYLISNLKTIRIKNMLSIVFPFLILGLLGIFWPKYTSLSDPKSLDMGLFFTSIGSIFARLTGTGILPYIGYILLPFTASLFFKLPLKIRLLIFLIAIPASYFIYQTNIFIIGNLFYLEGLYARLGINIRENLFNNVPFKMFISILVSISFTTLLVQLSFFLVDLIKMRSRIFPMTLYRTQIATLTILLIGFYLVVMVTDRVFDRYLLNFFVILVLLTTFVSSRVDFQPGVIFSLALTPVVLISFVLTYDYYRVNQLKWSLAERITVDAGVSRDRIFVDQEYLNTVSMEDYDNYRGLFKVGITNYSPTCFVQEYTKQEDSMLNMLILNIQKRGFVRKYLPNPLIRDVGLLRDKKASFNSRHKLYYDVEYISPLYNLLGKRTFVRAFCSTQ